MHRTPFSLGTIILGGGALFLICLILVGVALPASWEAEVTLVAEASPEELFQHLDSPEGWRGWTFWPDSGVVRSGPETGSGATLSWDDEELGSGSFTIAESDAPRSVRYQVQVGRSMRTEGTIELTPNGTTTSIAWRESGDLGRNPLMGYWAFFMNKAQTRELTKGLGKLAALGAETTVLDVEQNEAPADSGSTGASR